MAKSPARVAASTGGSMPVSFAMISPIHVVLGEIDTQQGGLILSGVRVLTYPKNKKGNLWIVS
jgi:hypothetical protein